MRPLPLMAAAVLLLTACGTDDRDAGCVEGQLNECARADGRAVGGEETWPTCLSIAPATIDFGSSETECVAVEAEVAIDNRCGVPVRLDRLVLEDDGGAFLLLDEPSLPMEVRPGTTRSVSVGYRPSTTGTHAGELGLGFEGFEPVAIPVSGEALEKSWTAETFKTAPRRQADILFVIDNGSSMADDTQVIRDNLASFVQTADAQGIDYHIGVTTTGLEPGGDCPGGVGGGEDGRLFPVEGDTPRILAADTPDLEAAWSANVDVGACREGPNRVFEAVLRALTPPVESSPDDPRHPEENDGNAGFLRPGAYLSVVVVTDRDDDSPESSSHYYGELLGVKGLRNSHLFGFHVIAGDQVTGCVSDDGRTAAPADRLLSVVETNRGLFQSICEPDWRRMFQPLHTPVFPPACFHLSQPPSDINGDGSIDDTEGELEVVVNGLAAPSKDGWGNRAWYYLPEDVALCFGPLYLPGPDSTVVVRYRAGCR